MPAATRMPARASGPESSCTGGRVDTVTTISVIPAGSREFDVTLEDDASTTTHRVSVPSGLADQLGADSPDHLVEASFRFLLEREPKESIMRSFELTIIERFFPEYRSRIGDYL